jgi:hypothetical protein
MLRALVYRVLVKLRGGGGGENRWKGQKSGEKRHNRHRPRAIIHAKPGHLDVDVVVVVVVANVPWLWESW